MSTRARRKVCPPVVPADPTWTRLFIASAKLAGALATRASRPGQSVLPIYRSASHRLDFDGLRMHYVDEGAGRRCCSCTVSRPGRFSGGNHPAVVGAGYRAIAPDLIGFGRSDKPPDVSWYTYDRHVASVERLVDVLGLEAHHARRPRLGRADRPSFRGRARRARRPARHPRHRHRRREAAERDVAALSRGRARSGRRRRSGAPRRVRHRTRSRRRRPRRLRRAVPDAGAQGRSARVPRLRPRPNQDHPTLLAG